MPAKKPDDAEKVKHYSSPRWTTEVTDCALPVTLDQYSNCAYGCLYCFATYSRAVPRAGSANTAAEYLANKFHAVNVDAVKRIATGEKSGDFQAFFKQRRTIQWGGLSDPFCHYEKKAGTGLELLRFFAEKNYPISFSTKGVWWLDDPRYTELFQGRKNWHVKVSIVTADAAKAKILERGVPSPQERLRAIERLVKLGIGGVTLRLRPFMVGITDPTHVELIETAGRSGAYSVSTEFFCLDKRSTPMKARLPILSRLAGFNYETFYREQSKGTTGYQRLNREVKRPFVDAMMAACERVGMKFFMSDSHFKERSESGGCCGLPPTFDLALGQFTQAAVLCRKNGRVTWGEIAEKAEHLKAITTIAHGCNVTGSSESRAHFRGKTMFDYLHWLWNNPSQKKSPYKEFGGVMKPTERDAAGDVVYVFDAERA